MGVSLVLIEKPPFELAVDIDRDISIEISTGFGKSGRPTTHTSVPVSVDDIAAIIRKLQEIHIELMDSWICVHCKLINPSHRDLCGICEEKRDYSVGLPHLSN